MENRVLTDDWDEFNEFDQLGDRHQILSVSDPWTERTRIREETYRTAEFADGRTATLWLHHNGWWREVHGSHYDGGYYYKQCGCGRWFGSRRHHILYCSPDCEYGIEQRRLAACQHQEPYNQARSRKAAEARSGRTCAVCGTALSCASSLKTYCSSACRQKAHRHRKQEQWNKLQASARSIGPTAS